MKCFDTRRWRAGPVVFDPLVLCGAGLRDEPGSFIAPLVWFGSRSVSLTKPVGRDLSWHQASLSKLQWTMGRRKVVGVINSSFIHSLTSEHLLGPGQPCAPPPHQTCREACRRSQVIWSFSAFLASLWVAARNPQIEAGNIQ